jgi:hypothetical protein
MLYLMTMIETHRDSFFGLIIEDASTAISRNLRVDDQATRRDVIRTAFAAIEGLVWILRVEVVDAAEATYGLDDDERAILRERQLTVSEQGKVISQTRYLTLTATIRLVARIASRVNGHEHFNFGGHEWERFRAAMAIRNRITHPKCADDLEVSKADVSKVTGAFFWLLDRLVEVLSQSVQTRKEYLSEYGELLEKLQSGDPEVTALYDALRDHET